MTTPSKVTSPRRTRKTKSIPVVKNVSIIDPKRRQENNMIAYQKIAIDYLNQLTPREQDAAIGFADLLFSKAAMIRRAKPESSEVIQFPSIKNSKSKSAMEA